VSPFPDQHLYTGGKQSPFLPGLLAAINHATQIDITTAFIRQTGLVLITDALEEALCRNVRVRILTGDYLGITDPAALRTLMVLKELGAEVKIFESLGKVSFHMKAYLFIRQSGDQQIEGCAFVGSSNISQAALQTGLEWNLRVDAKENRKRFEEIADEFETIFQDPRSRSLDHDWIDQYAKHRPDPAKSPVVEAGADEELPPPEPNTIQEAVLEALRETRKSGYRRGLVVMATGLGKTWLSAFDTEQMYARRVLFVAHRDEILTQAEHTFVRIRPNAKTGKYTGNEQQLNVDMLFASIQTLGKQRHLQRFDPEHFDYIIVDEFHHAAARTYQQLLSHFTPRFLLGLTATPDRTDQADILSLCDDNLVYSCDLFDGVREELLCTFSYFGVGDTTVNYQAIPWRNGKFDPNELSSQLATQARARHSYEIWTEKRQQRTLGFCVSKRHADFMTDYFNRQGARAVAVYSDSTVRRNEGLDRLRSGEIDILFSVDLFNEGVDVPSIDTVLMLRPTESKILFLQQLGRGLRKSLETGKEQLVVIDFIGNHHSFFRKVEALFEIGRTLSEKRSFVEDLEQGRLDLPEGCFINYDVQAIDFLKQLTASRTDIQEERYTILKDSLDRRPTLSEFYLAGGSIDTLRKEYGNWFQFVSVQEDLNPAERNALATHGDFLQELETTRLSKSYKLVLLDAFLDQGGFQSGVSVSNLAQTSFDVLHRKVRLLSDLPESFAAKPKLNEAEKENFRRYWLKNPINAWVGGNTPTSPAYFNLEGDTFTFTSPVSSEEKDSLSEMVRELINYRYLQYEQRLETAPSDTSFTPEVAPETIALPFFTDLRIACGHFATSAHETDNIETRDLPITYGKLNPSRHFIARAHGNSMNGGKNPICDGDYLLLEAITSSSAGHISDRIIAIERQDTFGEDQYLLRTIRKEADGRYLLDAQNPDYETMPATEDMRTFARFLSIVDPADMLLHQRIYKQDVAEAFGMEYKEGLWKLSGHVCPKASKDQFFFVTLNKQGAEQAYQYHDHFPDPGHFHWQSQAKTTPIAKKGRRVIHHSEEGSDIHLFVRKHKAENGKSAPFYYCGSLNYQSHKGSEPMDVDFKLNTPLPLELFEYFNQ
jgi:superfamily II DNA or RNA helicase/SOS-response transcriptional repressor LexA